MCWRVFFAACATIAEVRKRGEDFWSEFEFYLSDLTVGLVLDVLLVGLMATPAVISKHHVAHNSTGKRVFQAVAGSFQQLPLACNSEL